MCKPDTNILCFFKPERNMLAETPTVCQSSPKEDKYNFTEVNEVTGFVPGTGTNAF